MYITVPSRTQSGIIANSACDMGSPFGTWGCNSDDVRDALWKTRGGPSKGCLSIARRIEELFPAVFVGETVYIEMCRNTNHRVSSSRQSAHFDMYGYMYICSSACEDIALRLSKFTANGDGTRVYGRYENMFSHRLHNFRGHSSGIRLSV